MTSAEPPPPPGPSAAEQREAAVAARLPLQRLGAGVIVRDAIGRVLLVEPTYKPTWEIPGGLVEADESPLQACRREVAEELGIELPVHRLLVVDWVPRRGVWPEGLLFVFDGGVLEEHRLADVRLPVDELAAARFVTLDEAREHLRPDMHRRLQVAREVAMSPDAPPAYLERGRRVLPPSRAIL